MSRVPRNLRRRPKGLKLENKWYPPKIFKLLSQEQQNQLKEWREKKGKRSVVALKKQIKEELKRKMKSGTGNDKEDDGDESRADDAARKEVRLRRAQYQEVDEGRTRTDSQPLLLWFQRQFML